MDQQRIVKTLLIGFFGFIILGLLSYIILGVASPSRYSGEVTEELDIPKRFIWKLLTEIDSIPAKRDDVERIEILGLNELNLEKWREFTDSKGFVDLEFMEKVPDRLVKIKMTHSSFGMTGTWTYDLGGSNDQKTVLTIKEVSESNRFVPRAMMILGGRDSYIKGQIEMIKYIYLVDSEAEGL